MPTYDYACKSCDFHVEMIVKIDDRDKPTQEPCPDCGTLSVERLVGAPLPAYTIDKARPKVPESFKDILRGIKKRHPHSRIEV